MTTLAADIVFGVGVGLLLGATSAFLLSIVGFGLEYYTETQFPTGGAGIVALALGVLGLGQLGVVELSLEAVPRITTATTAEPSLDAAPRIVTATIVVVVLGTYGFSQGQQLAIQLPRSTEQPTKRKRHLSAEAFDAIDGSAHVTIEAEVRELDGYPPLRHDIRETLSTETWRLPADLPLVELEARLADKLRSKYGLLEVDVSIDARGQATIAAAPATSGPTRRIPDGWRAVTIKALVPTGVSPGEDVHIIADSEMTTGILLGATSTEASETEKTEATSPQQYRVGAEGCYGQVTVAVSPGETEKLLAANRARLLIQPRGENCDFEALSLLESAGTVVHKMTVTEPIRDALLNHESDVHLLAVHQPNNGADGWMFEPSFKQRPGSDEDESVDNSRSPISQYAQPGADVFVAGETAVIEMITDNDTKAPNREVSQ